MSNRPPKASHFSKFNTVQLFMGGERLQLNGRMQYRLFSNQRDEIKLFPPDQERASEKLVPLLVQRLKYHFRI